MAFLGSSPHDLARLERKVDLILDHLGIDPRAGFSARVTDALARGKKIEAIKYYREETGLGLREAKHHIESLG